METHTSYNYFERRPIFKSKSPAVKWFKEWVPQDVIATGGKCLVLKWVTESTLKAIREKPNEPEIAEPEPEPTTEVLFLCSYENCGKTFIDAGALRKHSNIHGERQYVCQHEGCGKKFLDSSKLKRHNLIHTGERPFVCTIEGCGKTFSLDFNLKSHIKTHSQENYHICPYQDCGKRYAHEYKLRNHINSHHEKKNIMETPKYVQPPEKPTRTPKSSSVAYGSASSERPHSCPYEGCDKAYIHEYKLNLHLRREHPGHFPEENTKNTPQSANENEVDEASEPEAYISKRGNSKNPKQNRPKPSLVLPYSKIARKGSTSSPGNLNNIVKKPWPAKEEAYEEDSEETEEDRDSAEDGWRYRNNNNNNNNNEDDDEETEDED